MTAMITEQVAALYLLYRHAIPERIEQLPQSGSDRIYFRVYHNNSTCIAAYNLNTKENETFLYYSKHFKAKGLPVPAVFCVNEARTIYLQEDAGTVSLLDRLEQQGPDDEVYGLFKQSLQQLAQLQLRGHEGLSYDYCLTGRQFGKQAILSDLLYCKYYFLDTLKIPYDKQGIMDDFETLGNYLTDSAYQYFMFRDFQSRNIMVKDGAVFFIDYQGGMQGALQYDVASLLWQARAGLSDHWKQALLHDYLDAADALLEQPVNRPLFISQYNGYVLIRLLQVLGAYGFRGLFERKAHFLSSIAPALRNLQWFLQHVTIGIELPCFYPLLKAITTDEVIARFETIQANDGTKLVIKINSFSYKKNGIPPDATTNGGGFVFDCRGLLNPGRFDAYKTRSGQDKSVQDFLEQQTRMNEFLNSVYNLVDISAEDYLQRNFESLQINFGCTGGQHRSVYAAEQTARHLRNKFHVKVQVTHCNQANWVRPETTAAG